MVSTKKKRIGVSICVAVPALIICMGATATLASERNAGYMEACSVELNKHYGQEMDISLVSKRRIPAGVEVKLAARLDSDNVEFLNCWVPKNDLASGEFNQHSNAVAITVKPVLVIQ